jgi:uncharacterized membrane protein
MSIVRPFAAVLVFGLLALSSAPAKAAFLFCNRTQSPIEAAFGYREQVIWISEGWWQIQPGQCARVFNRPLTQRFYFYFGRVLAPPSPEGKPPATWGGKYRFCTDNKAFRVEGDSNCDVRGYQEKGFQEVDIGPNKRNYTLSFEDGSSR